VRCIPTSRSAKGNDWRQPSIGGLNQARRVRLPTSRSSRRRRQAAPRLVALRARQRSGSRDRARRRLDRRLGRVPWLDRLLTDSSAGGRGRMHRSRIDPRPEGAAVRLVARDALGVRVRVSSRSRSVSGRSGDGETPLVENAPGRTRPSCLGRPLLVQVEVPGARRSRCSRSRPRRAHPSRRAPASARGPSARRAHRGRHGGHRRSRSGGAQRRRRDAHVARSLRGCCCSRRPRSSSRRRRPRVPVPARAERSRVRHQRFRPLCFAW
jgi:hypothetical protein